jgi:hypothetical protein
MEGDLLENLIIDDNEFFKDKINKRLNKQDLEIKKLRKENSILKSRVNNVEVFLQNLLYQLDLKNKINKDLILGAADEIEESWLYFVKKGQSKEDIFRLLKLNSDKEKEKFFFELEANEIFIDEKKMICQILKSFQTQKKFPDDWQSMDKEQLNIYLGNIFNSLMMHDTIIYVRSIPNKTQKNYENILSNLATLAGIMYYSWEELNSFSEEVTGKMALILESDEELQILNVHKKNSRLILSIEPLIKNQGN